MNALKKIWNVVSTFIVIIIVICAMFLRGARLLGYKVYTVISGSMEPEYSVGDLLYVKDVEASAIKVGDPITFILNEELVVATHRVVRVDTEKQCFYTKGDANEIEDSEPVHFNKVIGVPEFALPKIGYISDFVQSSPGMYITIGIGAVLIILVFLPDMIKKKKTEDEKIDDIELDSKVVFEENTQLKEELERLREELQSSKDHNLK